MSENIIFNSQFESLCTSVSQGYIVHSADIVRRDIPFPNHVLSEKAKQGFPTLGVHFGSGVKYHMNIPPLT